jgi:hypothetical protein
MQSKLLGHGACATCFSAEDKADGQTVALKVIRRSHIYTVGLSLAPCICCTLPCACTQPWFDASMLSEFPGAAAALAHVRVQLNLAHARLQLLTTPAHACRG